MSFSNDSKLDDLSTTAEIGSPSPGFSEPFVQSDTMADDNPLTDNKLTMRYLAFINVLILSPSGNLTPPTYLFVDTHRGIIIAPDEAKQEETELINCHGMILSPGLIDIQINGAFGVDLSEWKGNEDEYKARLRAMGEGLVKSGVTSYVPTLIVRLGPLDHEGEH